MNTAPGNRDIKKERQREDDFYCFGAVYFHDGR